MCFFLVLFVCQAATPRNPAWSPRARVLADSGNLARSLEAEVAQFDLAVLAGIGSASQADAAVRRGAGSAFDASRHLNGSHEFAPESLHTIDGTQTGGVLCLTLQAGRETPPHSLDPDVDWANACKS